jgi:hypothetical protein
MHGHWAAQRLTLGMFQPHIHPVGRDSYPFSSGRRSRPRLRRPQCVACSQVHLLFGCRLLACKQLADAAQGHIVAEDAKASDRAATNAGDL